MKKLLDFYSQGFDPPILHHQEEVCPLGHTSSCFSTHNKYNEYMMNGRLNSSRYTKKQIKSITNTVAKATRSEWGDGLSGVIEILPFYTNVSKEGRRIVA
ncbi:hypothetical protein AGMMS49983_07040 [Clostridia bacterium]|nr:hypothetical protein AGMMS49983_07040 [Clostridia bacterium]